MLVQLSLEQVAKFWDVVKYSIEESLPPIAGESPGRMNDILASLLSGAMQCWVSYDKENTNRFEGVVVTEIIGDQRDRSRALLVYSLYGYSEVSDGSWAEGYNALSKWARSEGCGRMIGYTSNEKVIRTVRSLGGNADYTFVSLPTKEGT